MIDAHDAGNERWFDLGDILSVTGEKLVSPRLVAGVYDILNYMTGESLYTHQLPRVCKEARPVLLFQHPQLAEVDDSSVNGDNWQQWLHEQKQRFGDTLPVKPMNANEHERIDPLSELAEKVHPNKIVVVSTD